MNNHKIYYIEKIHNAINEDWKIYYQQCYDYETRNIFHISSTDNSPILQQFLEINYEQLIQKQKDKVQRIILKQNTIPSSGIYYDKGYNNYYFGIGYTGTAVYYKL